MATATKATKKATKAAAPEGAVEIPPVETLTIPKLAKATVLVTIRGTAPLVVHRFSEKAKRIMLEAMQGRKQPKEPKNPEEECLQAAYRFADGGYGFPSIGIKSAMVSAGRFYRGVTMTSLRQTFFVRGELGVDGQQLFRILGGDPEQREDVVRVGQGGTDLRYRPQWPTWSAALQIEYYETMIDGPSILALLDAAGGGVGIGEWRPERKGDFGTFEVDPDVDVVFIRNQAG